MSFSVTPPPKYSPAHDDHFDTIPIHFDYQIIISHIISSFTTSPIPISALFLLGAKGIVSPQAAGKGDDDVVAQSRLVAQSDSRRWRGRHPLFHGGQPRLLGSRSRCRRCHLQWAMAGPGVGGQGGRWR
ncbi:hypothetical protein Salat_1900900 [Sesamum alatum]|uniref:Uncharacterized protein n=1 Tax=Sesamum alatum TaxID=300844 RepID=A0AAE1Y4S6_9LAMI|nr:hypothetical protein Salat_1900900 [Sesamum alatum]